jgi:peroxiredoxin
MKLKAGTQIQRMQLNNIKDETVDIPNNKGKYVHIQFRRFSGCPVCNLHLQEFIKRKSELDQANIQEVVFFHSSKENLLEYQGQFPFDVIADPQKNYYKEFGVEQSIWAILHPKAIWASIKGNLKKNNPRFISENGILGLPADFLVSPQGEILGVHYGKHASDQWTMEAVIGQVRVVR